MTQSTSPHQVTLLAIGTELTSGQITNSNATWISERLTRRGFSVQRHEVVPDDRELMKAAMMRAAATSDLLIMTGGLGPTSDDFTRDVISEWTGRPLVYRESSWNKIVARLSERGIEIAESNRQQCSFPETAEVLENGEGTADAFRLTHDRCEIVVLPGPPREGKHVWDQHVHPWLETRFSHVTPERYESFLCIGKSESALGEIVDRATAGSGLRVGFRASIPYVEVKLWVPKDVDKKTADETIARVASEVAAWTVAKNGDDLAELFLEALAERTGSFPITILDVATQGILSERLIQALKSPLGQAVSTRIEILTRYNDAHSSSENLPEHVSEWIFGLFPDGKAFAIGPSGRQLREIPSPYASALMNDRLRRYRTEMALKAWGEMLSLSV